jgi:hypothetical protein
MNISICKPCTGLYCAAGRFHVEGSKALAIWGGQKNKRCMKIERNARKERSSTNSSANAEAARNKQNKSHSDPLQLQAGMFFPRPDP